MFRGIFLHRVQGFLFSLLILAVYISGGFIPVMEIDAAQYASIALEVLQGDNPLHFYHNGVPYLDKPPLLFWLSALSYEFFDISDFTYKLPSLISSLLTVTSIVGFCKLYYDSRTAWSAAIVYLSAQGIILFNHDIRTDTLLTAFVMFAIYQMNRFLAQSKISAIYWSAIGIALAMLAKGPLGLMVPTIALIAQLFFTNQWKKLLTWHILFAFLVILVILFPMVYGLYTQFDQHPEIVVNQRTDVSGLYFYFWEQSFGRITGSSSWTDDSNAFYFIQNGLWSFLPWVLFAVMGLFKVGVQLLNPRLKSPREIASWVGFLIPLVIFSMSHYKLPHYLFVCYPLLSILSALSLIDFAERPSRWVNGFHYLILTVYILAIGALFYVFQPSVSTIWIGLLGLLAVVYIHAMERKNGSGWVLPLASSSLLLNLILNIHFYPQLLTYQSSRQVVTFLKERSVTSEQVAFYRIPRFGLRFYYESPVLLIKDLKEENFDRCNYLVTDETGYSELQSQYSSLEPLQRFADFRVTKLTPQFLNPKTREDAVNFTYLIKLR